MAKVMQFRDPQVTLGTRLWMARVQVGGFYNLEIFRERVGAKRGAIQRWERDEANPPVEVLKAWARETGVSMRWLLGIEPEDGDNPSTKCKPKVLAFSLVEAPIAA